MSWNKKYNLLRTDAQRFKTLQRKHTQNPNQISSHTLKLTRGLAAIEYYESIFVDLSCFPNHISSSFFSSLCENITYSNHPQTIIETIFQKTDLFSHLTCFWGSHGIHFRIIQKSCYAFPEL